MLDVYEDYLYVSTYKQHKVLKFSKFYNKMADDTQELKDKSMFVGDIVTYQIQKQNLTQEKGKIYLFSFHMYTFLTVDIQYFKTASNFGIVLSHAYKVSY